VRVFEEKLMKRTISAISAAVVLAGALAAFAPTAHAEGGRVAAGVAGGLLGGLLLGGAIAGANGPPPPPPGYYSYGPPPGPVYVDEPVCQVVPQQYWDGYMWRYRRVQVCQPAY
jgi:hypothetical protein